MWRLWTGFLIITLLAFWPNARAISQDASSSAVQSVIQSTRDEIQRKYGPRAVKPVGVAGVARTTARRCAAGVYNC
jgi:hypothetical protein